MTVLNQGKKETGIKNNQKLDVDLGNVDLSVNNQKLALSAGNLDLSVNKDKHDIPDVTVEVDPTYPRMEWEKDMTNEDLKRVEFNAIRLKELREKQGKRAAEEKKIKRRFASRVRFWFDEKSFIVFRDVALLPAYSVFGDKANMMLTGGYVGFIMGLAFVLGRLWNWFVPAFYLGVLYTDEENCYVVKCLLVVWIVTKVVKCIFKQKEDTYHHAMMNVYHKPTDWLAIGNGIGFYVEIGIILGLTYLVYGDGYG